MGLNAGLYIIPAKKFAVAQAKGTWRRYRWHKCRPWFDVDKAWWRLDEVFKRRSAPLAYAIDGNVRPTPKELGFAFVSPDVVAQIAEALADLPTEEIVNEIERDCAFWQDRDRQVKRGYYETFIEELRKAYALAAAEGAAMGI